MAVSCCLRTQQAVLNQQSLDLRLPPHEVLEQVQRVGTATPRQYPFQEAVTGLGVEYPVCGKGRKDVRREHLSPLVAVISGCISSRRDVGEAVLKAVELRDRIHRCKCLHTANQLHNVRRVNVTGQLVKAEVDLSELQLPHGSHRGLEVARRQQLPEERFWKRLAALVVGRDQGNGLRVPAPVLHQLARQLDGVPGDSVDTGRAQVALPGEHVVQTMTELMKQ